MPNNNPWKRGWQGPALAPSGRPSDPALISLPGPAWLLDVKPDRVSHQSSVPVFLPVFRADFGFLERHPLYEPAERR